MQKLISIIIPVYNHEKFIADTIESVIKQTYQNWEMLVVDDCSTDGSWNIIQEYAKKDSRIKIFRNEINKGLIENWKFLIDNSKGEFVAFLEGDDIFYEKNLEKKIEIFEEYLEVGMVYCNFNTIDETGNILIDNHYFKNNIKTFENEKIAPEDFILTRNAPMSSYSQVMIKREVLSISGYPRSLDAGAKVFLPSDWDFNFRVSTKNNIYSSNEILLGYRKHSNNSSSKTIAVSNQLLMILDEYEKEFQDNKAVLSAIQYMRGKTCYFNTLYYIENNNKYMAWKEFRLYAYRYPYNIIRDTFLNFKLIIRLFLPGKVNDAIRSKYYGK